MGLLSTKMLLQLLFISMLLCGSRGEPPVQEVVPYAAAGWRPRIPFNLPSESEYMTSFVFEEPQPVDVEFSKERVDFVGQVADNTLVTTKEPQNAYLPPSSDPDVIITQALPNNNPSVGFRPPTPRPSVKPIQFGQPQPQYTRPQRPYPQQNFNPSSNHPQSQFEKPQPQYAQPQRPYPQQNTNPSSNQPQSQFEQPQPQYTRPQRPYPQQNNNPSSNLPQSQIGQPQTQYTQPQRPNPQQNINPSSSLPQSNILPNTPTKAFPTSNRKPAEEYGPPPTLNGNTPFTIVYPNDVDPRTLDNSEDNLEDADTADLPQPRTTIEGLNAAIDEFYRNQNSVDPSQPKRTNIEGLNAAIDEFYKSQRELNVRGHQGVNMVPYNNLNEGRYYILTPENTLQRVSYRTEQDAEDARANGFTAQLKYATVGEVKDPIYKYNNQGQLVRVLK